MSSPVCNACGAVHEPGENSLCEVGRRALPCRQCGTPTALDPCPSCGTPLIDVDSREQLEIVERAAVTLRDAGSSMEERIKVAGQLEEAFGMVWVPIRDDDDVVLALVSREELADMEAEAREASCE